MVVHWPCMLEVKLFQTKLASKNAQGHKYPETGSSAFIWGQRCCQQLLTRPSSDNWFDSFSPWCQVLFSPILARYKRAELRQNVSLTEHKEHKTVTDHWATLFHFCFQLAYGQWDTSSNVAQLLFKFCLLFSNTFNGICTKKDRIISKVFFLTSNYPV